MKEYIVLITKEHYNPLGIVRTLGEAGIRPIVVAVHGDLKFVGQSKYVKEKYYVDSTEDGIDLIIDKFANLEEKSFILTGDDVTVAMLDKHYDRLKDYFYFYNAGESGRIAHYMNKDVMMDLVVKHGIQIAKTWKVKVGDIPDDIVYPIMTKAINSIGSEWKNIVYICHNDAELKEAFGRMKSEKVLVQQYIEKVDELSFDAISVNSGKDVWVITEATQVYNIPDKYSPYWYIKNSENKEIQEKIARVIEEIGLEGIFEFEFMQDKEGNLWFLEINFRNTALGYSTTVAGMPQVVYWCESMENRYIDKEKYYKRISDSLTAMAECFDYDVRVKAGIISKEEWLKEYKLTEDFLLLNADAIFDIDFNRFVDYHRKKGGLVTLFTHPNSHPYDSGLIIADKDGSVKQWLAKEDARPTYYQNRVNAGLHVLSPSVLNTELVTLKVDLDRQILKPLAGTGKMFCYDSPEYVKDMGTPKRYEAVCQDFRNGTVKAKNLIGKQKAIFLDRDGTINKHVGFLRDINDFALNKGAADAIRKINNSGYLAIVVTNQPVIARGEVTLGELQEIHNKMETLLGLEGAYLDSIYFCPHHPHKGYRGEIPELKVDCDCRKPKPGLLLKAAEAFNIDLSQSWMIGDSENDVIAGKATGCKTGLIGKENYGQTRSANSLPDLINLVLDN